MRHAAFVLVLLLVLPNISFAELQCPAGEKPASIITPFNFDKIWISADDLSKFDEISVTPTNNTVICWSADSVVQVQTAGTVEWVTIKFDPKGEQILTAAK